MLRWIFALCLALAPSLAFAQASGVVSGGGGISGTNGDCTTVGTTGTVQTNCNASGAYYRAGAYYIPGNITPAGSAGLVQSTTKVACFPGTINKLATISALGAFITTVSSGGNVQFAVYTDGGGRPNNLVAMSSASASTTTAGSVSTSLTVASAYTGTAAGGTSASGNVQLGPLSPAGKELWWCTETDNTTAIMNGTTSTSGTGGSFIGSATLANVLAQTTEVAGVTTASTFGTWPASLSGSTWTDIVGRGTPIIAFLVQSIP